ncbi:hypothetical protein TNCV_3041691 [Trichonephila clavipes]|nr:hypothetical protein TNCV_3041691 [Trichonephila clavipes]
MPIDQNNIILQHKLNDHSQGRLTSLGTGKKHILRPIKLTYWALNVGWPVSRWCFLYWWTWKETVGGAKMAVHFGSLRKNQVQIRASRREARLLLSSGVGERELYSLRLLVSRM